MTTINSEQFREICSGVWRDRTKVLRGRGFLSGEIALVRAVYWRLCKTGMAPIGSAENYGSLQSVLAYQAGVAHLIEFNASPQFDVVPFLNQLLEQYQNEVRTTATSVSEPG